MATCLTVSAYLCDVKLVSDDIETKMCPLMMPILRALKPFSAVMIGAVNVDYMPLAPFSSKLISDYLW